MLHEGSDRFRMLGGTLCLDFVNTVGGREETKGGYAVARERLEEPGHLREWASAAGLKTKDAPDLRRAIRFREALYRIFRAAIDGRRPDAEDLAALNRELAAERLAYKSGRFTLGLDDDSLLAAVAADAVKLLTSDQLARVRQCGGESCGWLFLDTSRNRSRQWCDMRDCGNLAKVRRFRERQKM
ncbi:MAG TPA: ABATE domain-containing protein [Thermoanaerobaculia bacterium]